MIDARCRSRRQTSMFLRVLASLVGCVLGSQALAQVAPRSSPASDPQFSAAASEPILPPLIPWEGRSRALVVAKDDPWITPAETMALRKTPSYDETFAWLRKLVAAALKDIYRAIDPAAAEAALTAFEVGAWGRKYAAIGQSWRRAWG